MTTIENPSMGSGEGKDKRKSLKNKGFEGDCGRLRVVERKLPGQDSNLDKESQNLLCYRYTTG